MGSVWDEAMDDVGSAMEFAFFLTLLIVFYIGYFIYKWIKQRHDPPRGGPWSDGGGVSVFDFEEGLHLGETFRWN